MKEQNIPWWLLPAIAMWVCSTRCTWKCCFQSGYHLAYSWTHVLPLCHIYLSQKLRRYVTTLSKAARSFRQNRLPFSLHSNLVVMNNKVMYNRVWNTINMDFRAVPLIQLPTTDHELTDRLKYKRYAHYALNTSQINWIFLEDLSSGGWMSQVRFHDVSVPETARWCVLGIVAPCDRS